MKSYFVWDKGIALQVRNYSSSGKVEIYPKVVDERPWWLRIQLPNVLNFKVLSKQMDKLAEAWGLERVKSRELRLESNLTNPWNKFLKKAFTKLDKLSQSRDREGFDKLALILLRSRAFALQSLFEVDRRFYKDRSMKQVIWTLKRLLRLIRKDSQIMKFRRIMLEKSGKQGAMPWKDYLRIKPEGNWRPLSVPTLEWRVFNHMKYVLAAIWLEPTHAEWQHGARPRRGTGTALAYLVQHVVKKPFIWEFDLTKFFDRVNWYQLTITLGFYQVPMNSLARWINNHVKKNPLGMEDSAYWEESKSKWDLASLVTAPKFSK